ncbi:hypothetical protein [Streptomyces marispadix]|uniref:Uncharacterized protein n=1 Tax=Streptomyces marispadix TaxID=2922868 RepID=A0ABS9SXE6_9ACTN|nr:hypothetical protein [Streptomyces marispadix]MCH6160949.1 hypothetical protein [Streptomyces marispadix]
MSTETVVRFTGLRNRHFQAAAMGSIGLCLTMWMRASGLDQEERGNAERRAIFVGLWAPTLLLLGQSLSESE